MFAMIFLARRGCFPFLMTFVCLFSLAILLFCIFWILRQRYVDSMVAGRDLASPEKHRVLSAWVC